jgi:hypothetical protein
MASGKDTVVDDLRALTAEQGFARIGKVLAKLNEVDRLRVLRALIELYAPSEIAPVRS